MIPVTKRSGMVDADRFAANSPRSGNCGDCYVALGGRGGSQRAPCSPSLRFSQRSLHADIIPKGERRPADVIGNAVRVMRNATGEVEEVASPTLRSTCGAAVEARKAAREVKLRHDGL